MSVSGTDDVDRTLKKLSELDMKQAVADTIQTVRAAAVLNCPVDTGELRQSIYADVEGDANRAVGTCWTNRAYAPYVEFGTGRKDRQIMPEYPRKSHRHTRNPRGGSMKVRSIAELQKNIAGFTLILHREDSTSAQVSRHTRLCIRRFMIMKIRF